jgi:hypothetical protein
MKRGGNVDVISNQRMYLYHEMDSKETPLTFIQAKQETRKDLQSFRVSKLVS